MFEAVVRPPRVSRGRWPFAIASIVISTTGLLVRRGFLVWAGAFVGMPFMIYVFGTPRFWWLSAIAVPCHFGAAAAASRRSMLLGWVLFLPTPLATWHIAAAISASMRQG